MLNVANQNFTFKPRDIIHPLEWLKWKRLIILSAYKDVAPLKHLYTAGVNVKLYSCFRSCLAALNTGKKYICPIIQHFGS